MYRNKIKRFLRESYQKQEENLQEGYDIVFLVKKGVNIKNLDFFDIEKDMIYIFKKSNILKHSDKNEKIFNKNN